MMKSLKHMINTIMLQLFIVFCICISAKADQWARPQEEETYSQSKEYVVKIIPGESIGDTFGFAGAQKGEYAKAKLFKLNNNFNYELLTEVALVNPVAPVDFFVSNSGYQVTLDNWHNMGYGKIIAFYSPTGELIRSYELTDLFTEIEITQFTHSVSSIWWRNKNAHIKDDQKTFFIQSESGKALLFNIESGNLKK